MSGPMIVTILAVAFAIWASYLAYRYRGTRKDAAETFAAYRKDGTLDGRVSELDYNRVYMRTEGPRFGAYLFVTGVIALLSILVTLRVFNVIWNIVWLNTGQIGWFDTGELPHALATVFLYVAIMFGLTWISMQRYHKTAPGKLRNEIKKLNGRGDLA